MEQITRLGIGVIGCGLITQIMHLPHIRDLRELFHLRALCDLSPEVLGRVANDYQVDARYTNYQNLLAQQDIDAVLVLSSGNHAPIVLAALEAGKHVFVEKPLCFSLSDADRLIKISAQQNLRLMVGYMKWFDPAFQETLKRLHLGSPPQLLEITTVFTPEEFYYRHHRLHRFPLDPVVTTQLRVERAGILARELPSIPATMRDVYVDILLDSAIHDLYVLRGLIGDPKDIIYSSLWADGKGFHINWRCANDLQAHYTCILLSNPGGSYQETVRYYNSQQRLFLDFPSPYLRNMPTTLTVEEVIDGKIVRTQLQGSFEEAFQLELIHFHECIVQGCEPWPSGIEGRKDIALMQDAIRAALH